MDRRAAIAALALASSCADPAEPGPRLLGLAPSRGENAAPVAAQISGDHFQPRAVTDFTRAENSALSSDFQAFLLPSDPGSPEIALAEVSLQSAQRLTAVVPAGIARGFYGLKIVDPFGRIAQLPEVYRVVRSERELSAFRISALGPQRAGVAFWLEVTAVDAAGDIVDGFTGAVSVSNHSDSLTPSTLGPFAVGRARALVAIGATASADAVEVSDGLGHSGRSNDFAVEPGLAVASAFASAPQTLDAGACSALVELELRDAQGRAAAAGGDLAAALDAAPPARAAFFSDAACGTPVSSARFAAGQARAGFYLKAEVAGALMIRAQPDALPSAAQLETVRARPPSRLEFATPSQVLKAGACSPALSLRTADALGNASPPAAQVAVALTAIPPDSLTFFADDACATAAAGGALAASGELTFYARGEAPGSCAVRAATPATALAPGLLVLTVSP